MEEHEGKRDEALVLATRFSPSKAQNSLSLYWRGFYNPPSLNCQQGHRYPRSPSQRLQLPTPCTPTPVRLWLLPSSRQSNQWVDNHWLCRQWQWWHVTCHSRSERTNGIGGLHATCHSYSERANGAGGLHDFCMPFT